MQDGAALRRHPASFRDPAGFIFEVDGRLCRAVHPDAIGDVDLLFASGLHDELVEAGLLVRHRSTTATFGLPDGWIVLEADRLPVISYACEWTDAQLQAAALLTLDVQARALNRSMTLKDASAFNVQFVGARPVFIDLLSFTRLGTVRAWPAYRQFCEHFLGPLALRRHVPGAAGLAGAAMLDGVALPLASRLLPASTWLQPGLALHVHLHARSIASMPATTSPRRLPTAATPAAAQAFLSQLTASLAGAVRRVGTRHDSSAWSSYRQNNTYSAGAADLKLDFVRAATARAGARRALDLGANDGHYARAVVAQGVACTAVEVDAACAEAIYAASLTPPHATSLNTVRVDLTNPTPGHGWDGRERAPFTERLRCDITLSLALIHHLSIAHHVPFDAVAALLAELAPHAIVEYVPVDDPMARQLLSARTAITDSYLATLSEQSFLDAFASRFDCVARSEPLAGGRILFHFQLKAPA